MLPVGTWLIATTPSAPTGYQGGGGLPIPEWVRQVEQALGMRPVAFVPGMLTRVVGHRDDRLMVSIGGFVHAAPEPLVRQFFAPILYGQAAAINNASRAAVGLPELDLEQFDWEKNPSGGEL